MHGSIREQLEALGFKSSKPLDMARPYECTIQRYNRKLGHTYFLRINTKSATRAQITELLS